MDGPGRPGHHLRLCAAVALLACVSGCGDGNENSESASERTPTATATITSTPRVTPFVGTFTTTRTPSATMTPSPTNTPSAATTPVIEDLSVNLTDFEIERMRGFGFCPPLDEIFHAKASRGNDGVYRLDVSVLEPTTRNDPRCLDGFSGDVECAREVELPERDLTTEERLQLVAASHAVTVFPDPDPLCETTAFDPCLITNLRWTLAVGNVSSLDRLTFNATDSHCGGDRLPESEVQRFVALIEALR